MKHAFAVASPFGSNIARTLGLGVAFGVALGVGPGVEWRACPANPLHHGSAAAEQDALSPPPAAGEVVAEIDNSCWIIFQDRDGNYWFGSDGGGVTRFDGASGGPSGGASGGGGTLTRFTTKHGLAHDQVRGIQQHAPTGHILITTNGGVSSFDGERFTTLPITEMPPPALPLTPEGLAQAGWTLNDTDTWLTGSNGPRRYDGTTLFQLKFPECPHHDEWYAKQGDVRWNPYDVWTVSTDRRGDAWFGAGGMGVCRFDGHSLDWLYEQHLTDVGGGRWFGFRSIIEDRRGDFWICNTTHRFRMSASSAAPPGGDPARASSGKIAYTREPGIDPAALPPGENVLYFQGIVDGPDGNLWMAPYAGGVWKYDGNAVTHYPMKEQAPPHNEITMISIFTDNHGGIWVATHEHGPYRFNGTSFERFTPGR